MKRELKPFVVEVKRGKRRSPFGGQVESQDGKPSEASRRAEIALFAASPTERAAPQSQRSETIGRILPSLVEPAPTYDPIREDTPPRRRGRKPGSKNKPKVFVASEAPVSGAPASSARQRGASGRPLGQSGYPSFAPGAPVRMSVESVAGAETLPVASSSSIQSERGTPPARKARLRDRSRILARYVFGTEPAPGERWQRSSRRRAARASKYKIYN